MGRKNTVPYGIYVAHGFVSAHLAAQTKFSEEDLDILWKALTDLFEHVHACSGVSRPMIRVVLEALRKEGKVEVLGTGRGAKWRKRDNIQ